MSKRIAPKVVAEFIGTFSFVSIGAGSAAVIGGVGITAMALAHGLAVMAFAFTYGSVSGGHMVRGISAQRGERQAGLMTADAVSASIGHEIKQPLSAMMTNAAAGIRLLDRKMPDVEEAKAALRDIIVDGLRAGEVIDGIRTIFKKDARTRTSLNLQELIQETLALLSGELQARRILVGVQTDKRLPEVKADRVQLQQVFVNLFTNAIEAMASNDGPRVLRVTSDMHSSGGVIVSVKDTGAGVDPKHLSRLFNPLFTTKSDGMGMGLSICRSIVEAHDGQLDLLSSGADGAVFQIVLPLEAARFTNAKAKTDDPPSRETARSGVDVGANMKVGAAARAV